MKANGIAPTGGAAPTNKRKSPGDGGKAAKKGKFIDRKTDDEELYDGAFNVKGEEDIKFKIEDPKSNGKGQGIGVHREKPKDGLVGEEGSYYYPDRSGGPKLKEENDDSDAMGSLSASGFDEQYFSEMANESPVGGYGLTIGESSYPSSKAYVGGVFDHYQPTISPGEGVSTSGLQDFGAPTSQNVTPRAYLGEEPIVITD
jgi:hypothetical protein